MKRNIKNLLLIVRLRFFNNNIVFDWLNLIFYIDYDIISFIWFIMIFKDFGEINLLKIFNCIDFLWFLRIC